MIFMKTFVLLEFWKTLCKTENKYNNKNKYNNSLCINIVILASKSKQNRKTHYT